MLMTYDLDAVRRFTEEFERRLDRCAHVEGVECACLDEEILCQVKLCEELRTAIHSWVNLVFQGCIPCELEVERLLKVEAERLLNRAKEVTAHGRELNGVCYELLGLNALHFHVADFSFMLENWATPRRAVAPAPRVKLTEQATQQALATVTRIASDK